MARRGDGRGALLLLVLLVATVLFGLLRELPSPVEGAEPGAGSPLPPGWGAVLVGAPSGAEPILLEPAPAAAPEEVPAPEPDPLDFELTAAADFELVVQPGQVLSVIAQVYYGSARPELVQRLAEYNGLANPDALRAGQTLRLPSERRLLGAAGAGE